MNKTGKSGTSLAIWIAVILMAIVVVGGGIYLFGFAPQTAIGTSEASQKQVKAISTATKEGDLAYLSVRAIDQTSDTKSQVSAPLTCYEEGSEGEYLENADAEVMSASDVTRVTTSVGATVHCRAFNGTWYSDELVVKMNDDSETKTINVYQVTNDLKVRVKYDDSFASATEQNLSIGASLSDNFDLMEIELNRTNRAFNLWGFTIDTTASDSNISDITVGKSLSVASTEGNLDGIELPSVDESNLKIQRIKDNADYVWKLSSPLLLVEGDRIQTGSIYFKGDGDGCQTGGTGNESFSFYIVDDQVFKSAVDRTLKHGPEDDQPTPVDVGASDFNQDGSMYCNAP